MQSSLISVKSQSAEFYGTLIKSVYAAAKKEKWAANKTKEMLNNPKDFEKYLIKVGNLQLYNFIRQNLLKIQG